MATPETIAGLLDGAFDTHVHSAPDVLPRKFNDLELAERFKARRMAGFVLKSHYICTADRATLVRSVVPEVQAFGGIALNNSVGGLNPLALDIAGRLGTRVAWLPSVDNANELESIAGQRDESKLPYWMSIAREMRALGIAGSWLNVTQDGAVVDAARQCFEIIAKHDMVLATSHIRPSEVLPVVQAARAAGVQRIIVTHPEFPTTLLSVAQQQELARLGVPLIWVRPPIRIRMRGWACSSSDCWTTASPSAKFSRWCATIPRSCLAPGRSRRSPAHKRSSSRKGIAILRVAQGDSQPVILRRSRRISLR
jgi:hypothetical protein